MIKLVYGYYVKNSGIGRFISEILKRTKFQDNYEIITLENTISLPSNSKIRLINCGRNNEFLNIDENLNFSDEVNKIISNNVLDIFHSHGVYNIRPDIYTAHICFASYFEVLQNLFGADTTQVNSSILGLERRLIDVMEEERIFPVSIKVADELALNYGLNARNLRIIRGASRFMNHSSKKNHRGNKKIIGVVGNNVLAKGLNLFLDVKKELERRGIEIGGIIAGCENSTIKTLKEQDQKNLRFLGKIDIKEDFYTNLDCYLSLSAYEAYSLSCLEAMSLGIPVVSSRHNGIFYDAKKENLSLEMAEVDDIRNVEEVADLIQRIFDDNFYKEKIIKTGLDISNRQSWRDVAKVYEKIYSSLG